MTISTSIRSAVRTLITSLGNSISIYTYSSSTKAENTEGDITVSSWGAANSAKCVDGTNENAIETLGRQGVEEIGEDEIILRDDETITLRDRVTRNSKEYKVVSLRPVRAQDTLIAQIVGLVRVTGTTNWN
jgi:hypothetical protein